MYWYEYAWIQVSMISEEFMIKYKIHLLLKNWYIYVKICKGMYRLPQAGRIPQDLLQKKLSKYKYLPALITDGFWHHKTQPINFTLVVDDFGVKCIGQKHAKNIKSSLE